MKISRSNFIEEVNFITPFKDKSLIKLERTINSLKKTNKFFKVKHLIIYDSSSKNLINILQEKILYDRRGFYNLILKEASSSGIYSAINEALEIIPKESYYIVLGAGDLIINNKGKLKYPKEKIILFPYILSEDIKKVFYRKIRPIYSGMPYCHNAIAYINDGSRYNEKLKVSSDYEHFIKYIKFHKLKKENLEKNLQQNLKIEFDSKGISSKSKIIKSFENMLIIYSELGLIKILLFICHNFKRVIYKIWIGRR